MGQRSEVLQQLLQDRQRNGKGQNPHREDNVPDSTCTSIYYDMVARTQAPHIVMILHLQLCIKCLEPTLLNWCEGMLVNIKAQLTKVKKGKNQICGYGSFLVSFFFEKIIVMRPIILDYVAYRLPTQLRMMR